MIITINTNTGEIKIHSENELKEKVEKIKTAPINNPPIQYNQLDIKRKYYKKWDPEYHRKPIQRTIFKKVSNFLISDKVVKQEPLLEFH